MQETPLQKFVPGFKWRKGGFNHEVIDRIASVAVVKKVAPGSAIAGWEVVILRLHNGFTVGGRDIGPGEAYPSSESWGRCGWSFTNEMSARRRAQQLAFA